jgi:hypothetical protein
VLVVVVVGAAFTAFTALAIFVVVFVEVAAVAMAEPPTASAQIAATAAIGFLRLFGIGSFLS